MLDIVYGFQHRDSDGSVDHEKQDSEPAECNADTKIEANKQACVSEKTIFCRETLQVVFAQTLLFKHPRGL